MVRASRKRILAISLGGIAFVFVAYASAYWSDRIVHLTDGASGSTAAPICGVFQTVDPSGRTWKLFIAPDGRYIQWDEGLRNQSHHNDWSFQSSPRGTVLRGLIVERGGRLFLGDRGGRIHPSLDPSFVVTWEGDDPVLVGDLRFVYIGVRSPEARDAIETLVLQHAISRQRAF